MHQVTQNIRNGKLNIDDIPAPAATPGHVVIANACSLISAGTEKMVMDLARKSLLGKARERPDHVRRVLQKVRQEGFFNTLQQVMSKLDQSMKMGYSSAGVVIACGPGVQHVQPGDRVASNGPHAEIVSVPEHLCAHIPDDVPFDQASFAVLGAIALQGVRLARLGLGDTAFVVGLGLVGQLTVALLKAQGCVVLGTDPDKSRCEQAVAMGADYAVPGLSGDDIENRTRGLGADAVLITAATESSQPVKLAGEAVRRKGRVIAVGAVGLDLPRRPYYFKETEFIVSCSYGPGRYDPEYEERGRDYPAAYVRWTEQRNMQAVLDLMGRGGLDAAPLVSHRFPIEGAQAAYDLIDSREEPFLGILLEYPDSRDHASKRTVELKTTPSHKGVGIGFIGAGSFARARLLPAMRSSDAFRPVIICSAGGLSAADAGRKFGFEQATSSEDEVLSHEQVQAVVIATRHNLHAQQVVKALEQGKAVFVEKPLALTTEELGQVEEAVQSAITNQQSAFLLVGFNRRFAPASRLLKDAFTDVRTPLTITIRFNAGDIDADHWTQDEETGGGRLIGEACHGIDLATFLAGSRPVRVYAEAAGGPDAGEAPYDRAFITLRHANGAVSSIAYLAGGDKSFEKERVEVFGGGRVGVIEDFRLAQIVQGGRTEKTRFPGQDKGHEAEMESFAGTILNGGKAPIPWTELRSVSLAAILAVRSIREGIPFDLDKA